MCIYVCVHIYIYIYMHLEATRSAPVACLGCFETD